MSTKGGPLFTFTLPGGPARPLALLSVTPLVNDHNIGYLVIAANEAHFCDCYRNMGRFLCGVKRVKRFVNVSSHCIFSNLKMISKMPTLLLLENFMRTPGLQISVCALHRLHIV